MGAPYFDTMTLPIGLALLVLMAIGPALPWRKTTVGDAARPADGARPPSAWLVAVVSVVGGVRGIGAVLRLRPGRLRGRRQRPAARPGGPGRPPAAGSARGGASWAGPTAAWSCTSGWW